MSNNLDSLIVSKPEIRQGKPCISGTKITVHRIAIWYKQGYTPEQIADEYEHLNIAQVYAALTYYHANQSEIEADLAREDAEIKQLEQQHSKNSQIPIVV